MPTTEEVILALEKTDMELLILKLVKYANFLISVKYWLGEDGVELPSGKEAEDFAFTALEKLIDGRRSWNTKKCPDVEVFLKGIIRSEISNLVQSKENEIIRRINSDDGQYDANMIKSNTKSPEEYLIDKENKQKIWMFHDSLDDDPLLQKVFVCLRNGVTKRAEIANEIGVSLSEMTNINKRLKRRLEKFVTEENYVSKK